ncbi:hypothetical protein [Mycobacterium colombiense]|nr:hypothetical protein [Mycobacterium colombiense]
MAQPACAKSRTLSAVPTRIGGDESAAHGAVPHGPASFVASGRSSKLF